MKKLLLFLLVLVSFTACKKGENEIDPKNPAEAVAGSYNLTSFRFVSGTDEVDLPKMPYTQNGQTISGTVVLAAKSEETVTFTLTLKATGQKNQSIDIDNVEVKADGGAYGLYVDNQLVADADGDKIIFYLEEKDAQTNEKVELKFTASK